MGKSTNQTGRGRPSAFDRSVGEVKPVTRVDIHAPLVLERQYRTFPFIESWSRTSGFKSFAIRPKKGSGYAWTWKAQIPDGRHVYVHGFGETVQDCLLACDYALEREDWRTDKYS